MLTNDIWADEGWTTEQKRGWLRGYINRILAASDWTDLPNSGLTLSQQIEQQEIRLAWAELDDDELNPDEIVLPPYPLMERP